MDFNADREPTCEQETRQSPDVALAGETRARCEEARKGAEYHRMQAQQHSSQAQEFDRIVKACSAALNVLEPQDAEKAVDFASTSSGWIDEVLSVMPLGHSNSGLRETLIAADSLLSLVAHRPGEEFDPSVMADLKRVSIKCRKAADSLTDADALATKVAECIHPARHLGDLSKREWERCYEVLDALLGGAE
jgi:hypothetical protein